MTNISVKNIYPQPPIRRPFCCATLSEYVAERNILWLEKHKKDSSGLNRQEKRKMENDIPPHQCGAFARYKINGKFYCRKHGALKALDLISEPIE